MSRTEAQAARLSFSTQSFRIISRRQDSTHTKRIFAIAPSDRGVYCVTALLVAHTRDVYSSVHSQSGGASPLPLSPRVRGGDPLKGDLIGGTGLFGTSRIRGANDFGVNQA